MRVDNPRFREDIGEVAKCEDCPLDRGDDDSVCRKWWDRHGPSDDLVCPTTYTYDESIRFAEENT